MRKIKVFILLLVLGAAVAALVIGAGILSAKKREDKLAQLLVMADSSLADNEFETALTAVAEAIEEHGLREDLDRLRRIQALACEGLGRKADALDHWQALRETYPESPFAAEATLALAFSRLDRGGDSGLEAAHELFREVELKYPDTPANHEALYGFARIDLADGQLIEAQKTFLRLLDEAPDSPRQAEVEEILGDLNLQILRSHLTQEGEEIYEIKSGDTMEQIGKMFGVNYQLIMLINRIDDPRRIRPGRKLKIPNLAFKIVIDVGDNTLTLLNHGKFFKRYPVRTGERPGQTPVGKFNLLLKQKNPPWDKDGVHYEPGDPDNELGTRWMAFYGRDYGIHGTIKPETIGFYSSNGCVGMLMEDVEELYDLVLVGTPIEVCGERKPPRKRGDD
jgi:tetratricopeptide (TPR) repeat protein